MNGQEGPASNTPPGRERLAAAPRLPQADARAALLLSGAALALLLAAVLLDLATGEPAVERIITPRVVASVLAHHLPLSGVPLPRDIPYADQIVWQSRLPRVAGGAAIGALLALAGVAFQSLLMNPLADPYTVGVASGSALGSVAVLLLGGGAWLAGYAQPLAAFVCGLLAVVAVYAIASQAGRISVQTFLLAGVVVGLFFWAMIPLLISFAMAGGVEDRRIDLMATLFGSLQFLDWRTLEVLAPIGVLGGIVLCSSARELDLMTLGEETAQHLGVDVEGFKRRALLAGTLLTAAAVAAAGIIAFVGFVVPHAARRLVGPAHRGLLPTSMILGALLVVAADWVVRVYLHSVQIGVITSLLGVPVFCGMLRKQAAV